MGSDSRYDHSENACYDGRPLRYRVYGRQCLTITLQCDLAIRVQLIVKRYRNRQDAVRIGLVIGDELEDSADVD